MRYYIAILVLAVLPLRAMAADSPADPPAITLAQVLPTVQPPKDGVAMVIGANKTTLPEGATLPSSGLSLRDCADNFGLVTRTFGSVDAIAPSTMVVLNNNPGPPDLSDVLSPTAAFKELAASLTDSQWAKFTSESGIGLSDLDDDQQPLFWAIFPGRSLKIIPAPTGDMIESKEQPTDISTDLPQVHIRVAQKVDFFGRGPDGGFAISNTVNPAPGAPLKWVTAPTRKPPAKSLYGNLVRAEVDNQLKPSDLMYNSPALQVPIPLDGIRTVRDLALRIGHATRIEVYADPHYATRTVTFLGTDKTATASDLLQALALCVAGTYRAVGPAYVLTNDLVGIATTRETWEVYHEGVERILSDADDKTQAALYQKRGGDTISYFGDPLALSAQELAPSKNDPIGQFLPWLVGLGDHPYGELTSGQQAAAKQVVNSYAAGHAAAIAKNPDEAEVSNWKWSALPHPVAQLIAPDFSQPIALNTAGIYGLLEPAIDVENKALKAALAWEKQNVLPPKPGDKPIPPLADLLKKISHRALLAAPRSPDEVKTLVAAMQKMGLSELWLTVFADGEARIPNTPFPRPLDEKDDILASALAATKGTGIKVFPVASLLTWGHAPDAELRDLNVLGENSVVIAAREMEDHPFVYQASGVDAKPAGMWVSPFSSTVGASLTGLIKAMASRPGIGGLIWRDTGPPGYTESPLWTPLETFVGYTDAARLGFLRAHGVDPVDIAAGAYDGADFSIPTWDDSKLDSKEYADWRKYRLGADNYLLRGLYQTVRLAAPGGAAPTIFLQQRGSIEFPGNFAGGLIPSAPLPVDGSLPIAKPDINITTIVLDPDYSPIGLVDPLNRALTDKDTSYGGFALDIIPADGGIGAAGFAAFASKVQKQE